MGDVKKTQMEILELKKTVKKKSSIAEWREQNNQ